VLLDTLRLVLLGSYAADLRHCGWTKVLLECDLLALEGGASTAATTATAVTESTASTTTSAEAATSAAVTEATTASTAASTSAEASTSTAAAAAATTAVVWSAAGIVQADSTAVKVCTLELLDRLLGVLNGVEGDVTETLESSGLPKKDLV